MNSAYIEKIVLEAQDMTQAQLDKPDVYNDNTLDTLAKLTALAGFLRMRAAEASVMGDRKMSGYYKGYVEGLGFVIDSIKYKINANIK